MKKLRFIITIAIFVLNIFILVSCNKDKDENEVITVDGVAATSLSMDAHGDTRTVIVRGKTEWLAESTSWITVYPITGAGDTDVVVTISVGINTSEERIGSVLFSLSSGEFADVTVVQPAVVGD